MKKVRVHLENIPGSPYSQSAQHDTPKLDREGHDDYDVRTWRDKCTTNKDGQVCIPAMALKQALDTAASKLGEKVPGRGRSTYKNFFASGVICDADAPIANGKAITPKDAAMFKGSMNPQGIRGGSGRVPRRFPQFDKWNTVAEFTIIDDVITRDVFERHLTAAGVIVGIGRFRAEKGGVNGRFRPTKFEWTDIKI